MYKVSNMKQAIDDWRIIGNLAFEMTKTISILSLQYIKCKFMKRNYTLHYFNLENQCVIYRKEKVGNFSSHISLLRMSLYSQLDIIFSKEMETWRFVFTARQCFFVSNAFPIGVSLLHVHTLTFTPFNTDMNKSLFSSLLYNRQ